MALDYSKYLDVKAETDTGEDAPPIGHYFCRIAGWKTRSVDFKQGDGEQAAVRLTFKITAPDDDVDLDGVPEDKPVAGRLLNRDYLFESAGDMKALRSVAETACGINIKGMSREDYLNDIKNREVKVHVSHRMGSGELEGVAFSKVDKVLPVS
jgi:hypothetical protein